MEKEPHLLVAKKRRSIFNNPFRIFSRSVLLFFPPSKRQTMRRCHPSTHTEESHDCGIINNNSISFNEHCRYIENKRGGNRRDVVSRVVKVPGIILCYISLLVIVVSVVKTPPPTHPRVAGNVGTRRENKNLKPPHSGRVYVPLTPTFLLTSRD